MDRDALDLSTTNIPRLFRKYFIPTLTGMLSICLLTAIDGIFVGHGVGSDGIAAINIMIPIFMLLTGVELMTGAGCTVVASIHLARGRQKAARINATQALLFSTLVALLATIPAVAFTDHTSRLLGASDHLLPLVSDYMLWLAPSFLLTVWTTVGPFLIRLDGSPKLVMLSSIITSAINILLDWLFIFPLHWGVMGAALASTISIGIGAIIAIIYLTRHARHLRLYRLKMSRKSLRLTIRNISYQCRIGSSALLNETTMAALMFIGNQVFIHYLGDDGVGAFGIACYYTPFVFMVGNAVAQSAQPIISYNHGSRNHHRVRHTERIALQTALLCGIAVTLAFTLLPTYLTSLFIDLNTPAAPISAHGLPYFSAGFIFFILNLTAIGYYQSTEQIKPATLFALLRGILFLLPSFILLPRLLGTAGIWLAMPASELLTTLSIILFYLHRKNRDILRTGIAV